MAERQDYGTDWIQHATELADSWDSATWYYVRDFFPYPEDSPVRMRDWVAVVSHVSSRSGEHPTTTAERLARYVKAYAETHGTSPRPSTMKD